MATADTDVIEVFHVFTVDASEPETPTLLRQRFRAPALSSYHFRQAVEPDSWLHVRLLRGGLASRTAADHCAHRHCDAVPLLPFEARKYRYRHTHTHTLKASAKAVAAVAAAVQFTVMAATYPIRPGCDVRENYVYLGATAAVRARLVQFARFGDFYHCW